MRLERPLLVAALSCLLARWSPAQPTLEWEKTFGGPNEDVAYSVQQTTDGGYILAGYTYSFGAGRSDVYLLKTDANGNEVWSRTFGGSRDDAAYSVQQTADGGFIVAGYTTSFSRPSGDFDRDGDVDLTDFGHFQACFNGPNRPPTAEDCNDTDFDRDDDVDLSDFMWFTVSYNGPNRPGLQHGDADVYLIRTNGSGEEIWSRTFGGVVVNEVAHSVAETADGGFVVAGYVDASGPPRNDVYLLKTDATGHELWARTYGGPDYDEAYSVKQTADGGFVLVGYTASFGAGNEDVYLIKTDGSGNEIWSRTFGGDLVDEGRCVIGTGDGGFAVAGYTNSFGAGSIDMYLVKTDSVGREEWSRTYGGPKSERAYSVALASQDGFILAGATYSFGAGYQDAYVVGTDASGSAVWSRTFGGTSGDEVRACERSADGGHVVAGFTRSAGFGFEDVFVLRLAP